MIKFIGSPLVVLALVFSGAGHAFGQDMLSASVKASAFPAASPGDYIVGVDDVLDIGVIKPEPIAYTVTVAPDGAITFPYIGNVQVQGLTLPKVQTEVQSRLAEYMEFPVVSVALRESRSKKFVIYGQVMHPGAYPVTEDMTVLQAITTAGGLIESSSMGIVKILRPSSKNGKPKTIGLDIKAIFKGEHKNMAVLPGDTLTVQVDKFFVSGRVARPGAYPVEENMTILQAISLAGGFLDANATGKIRLVRKYGQDGKSEIFELDIETILKGAGQNMSVLSGDTLVVTVDKFFISGPVVRPGAYPVEENMTLLQALTAAGGLADPNAEGRLTLLRPKPGSTQFEFLRNPSIKAVLSGADQNAIVRPGDAIVVSTDKFFVYGEVQRPGVYSLEPTTTTLKAIAMAGGFTKFAKSTSVKVLRKNGESGKQEEIDAKIGEALAAHSDGLALKADDVVVVSEGMF